MTLIPPLAERIRRSRPATVIAAAVVALLLWVAGPPVLAALGGQSAPVGCESAVVGDVSNPCVIADSGGVDEGGGEDDVIEATPRFAG